MAHIEVKTENPTPSPQWLKNAVIYELNPKTFTSPDGEGSGSGSGTFRSTKEKLEYLKELGVNTIWLAGVTLFFLCFILPGSVSFQRADG